MARMSSESIFLRNLSNWPRSGSTQLEQRLPSKSVQLMKPVCNDGSIDVIFCMSLIHHLDIDKVSGEMLRVLAPTGYIVLKEPIRLSKSYAAVCKLVPEHSHISDFEHPLTQGELATIMEPFTAEGLRYFRLPIVPMTIRWLPADNEVAWKLSAWALRNLPPTKVHATSIAMRLRRRASDSASLAA